MTINWTVRFHNPVWWSQIIISIFSTILTYYSASARDLTSWSKLGEIILKALKNPFVLFSILVNVLAIINDPTTCGLSDSAKALTYSIPN